MAIPRKAAPAQTVNLVGQIPDPPKIPAEVLDRFDGMQAWQDATDRWWARFGDMLQRDLDQISLQFNTDEAAAKTFSASTLASIAAINAAIAQLQHGNTGTLQAQIDALTAALQTSNDALAAHIANTITHGTSSPIVGTQDKQDIDNKRIGLNAAGYGRFYPPVGVGNIKVTDTITIAVGEFMVVAAPFTVYGNLTIAGTVVII